MDRFTSIDGNELKNCESNHPMHCLLDKARKPTKGSLSLWSAHEHDDTEFGSSLYKVGEYLTNTLGLILNDMYFMFSGAVNSGIWQGTRTETR